MTSKDDQTTEQQRIFSADVKKVIEQTVGREHFADTLHRIIQAGIRTIEEAKARDS